MFFQTPLLTWIEDFLRKPKHSRLSEITYWFLWRSRNDRLFNDKFTIAEFLSRSISTWVRWWETFWIGINAFHITTRPPEQRCVSLQSQHLESESPSTLTTLSSLRLDKRNQVACCLAAFSMKLGKFSITRVELRMLSRDCSWFGVGATTEFSSKSTLSVLHFFSNWEDDPDDHVHAATLHRAYEFLQCDWKVRICHVYREKAFASHICFPKALGTPLFRSLMSLGVQQSSSNGFDKHLSSAEQQEKINEVRRLVGTLPETLSIYCSNATICRYLTARNWNVKKATKMLKDTIKWRADYKPQDIHWEEIAQEADTGKIYRSNCIDKQGRPVLVMRPSRQNTKSIKGQIRYLVYCMENAIMNLPPGQEKMVWLIDFEGFNLSHVSLKVTRETANVLQNHYPERLGLAILYNPPKFFEPFWMAAKVFLEPKTHNKVKFVYSDVPETMKIMEEYFDMERLESAFGGKDMAGFDIGEYAERMKEDDKKMPSFWTKEFCPSSASASASEPALETTASDHDTTSCPENVSIDDNHNGTEKKGCEEMQNEIKSS
ncbi:Phosphatidylinositol transfer protein 3 [Linum perenne]